MTFPVIPEDIERAAIEHLAGPGASRAALYSAQQKVWDVLDSIRGAVADSANCDVCGDFHPTRVHYGLETTPPPVPSLTVASDVGRVSVSYAAVPKLERESGGDKSEVWAIKRNGATLGAVDVGHDHAMCDPDRACGPSIEDKGVSMTLGSLNLTPVSYPIPEGSDGKTTARRLMDEAQEKGEQVAMARLAEAQKLVASLPMFPGGRIWSENQESEGVKRLMTDIEAEGDIDARIHEEYCEGGDDCCAPDRLTAPAAEEGMDPAYASRMDPEQKLRLIHDTVVMQEPFGTELARFRLRILAVLGIQ